MGIPDGKTAEIQPPDPTPVAPDEIPAFKKPKSILTLLKMPFMIAGHATGFEYEIPKDYYDMLGETGAQVMADFGPEITTKWLSVGVFGMMYGSCWFEWLKGFKAFKEEEARAAAAAAAKKKKEEKNIVEIAQHSRDRGEGVR